MNFETLCNVFIPAAKPAHTLLTMIAKTEHLVLGGNDRSHLFQGTDAARSIPGNGCCTRDTLLGPVQIKLVDKL